jgi:hypothetical protein
MKGGARMNDVSVNVIITSPNVGLTDVHTVVEFGNNMYEQWAMITMAGRATSEATVLEVLECVKRHTEAIQNRILSERKLKKPSPVVAAR